MEFIKRNYYKVYNSLGFANFDKAFFNFMITHLLFNIFQALPNVFINTFFLSKSNDIKITLLYNALSYIGLAIFMQVAHLVTRYISANVCATIGLVLYNILYIVLLVFSDHAVQFYWLIGLLSGMAGAFYWLSYGHRFACYTTDNNRENASSLLSIFTSLITLIFPMISGIIITSIGGDMGYLAVFGLALFVSIITTIKIIKLPTEKMQKRDIPLSRCFKAVFKTKLWRCSFLSAWSAGIKFGAVSFIFSVIIYKFIQSELLVGLNTFLCSGATIIASLVLAKLTTRTKSNRIIQIVLATTLNCALCLIMVFYPNVYTVMIFSVLQAFLGLFISIPIAAVNILPFGTIPNAAKYSPEMIAIKEIFVAVGRCMGVGLIFLVNAFAKDNFTLLSIALFVLIASQFVSAYLCKLATDEAEKIRANPENFKNYLID